MAAADTGKLFALGITASCSGHEEHEHGREHEGEPSAMPPAGCSDAPGPPILSMAADVSSFGYFQRGTARRLAQPARPGPPPRFPVLLHSDTLD